MSNSPRIDILFVGGGSGGHVTPLFSVAEEVVKKDASLQIGYVGQKGDAFNEIAKTNSLFRDYFQISAGKFRRYHGESFWAHLRDVKTIWLNVRDLFRIARGFVDSVILLRRLKPMFLFMKGGFVCVPLGFAARLLKIPYVTHDSDAVPGLANRLIAKGATIHATGMPAELYPYPKEKTVYTGVPVQSRFQPVDEALKHQIKRKLQVSDKKVVFVTGGGLGSQKLNMAIVSMSRQLLEGHPDSVIFHISGEKLFQETVDAYKTALSKETSEARVVVLPYTHELADYSAAADIVICRAGATTLAEFAIQGKACIVVPNPVLTGGQQTKNAAVFSKAGAILEVAEVNLEEKLLAATDRLLADVAARKQLETNLRGFAKPHASSELADIIVAHCDALRQPAAKTP
jgi:UDP-N-acetylglucosamine--N-acetylmuramyl-(pentapeptide) pyrophosphoryl-undecaprenol N-acetylglucosamine transferase